MVFSATTRIILLGTLLGLLLSISSCSCSFQGVDIYNPVVDVTPSPLKGDSSFKDIVLCERVRISGLSRLNLGSYANAYRVTLVPSVVIPERLHNKIQVCFHRNSSLGLCQCEGDEWRSLQKGLWSSVMSPYDDRYIDIKFVGDFSGSVMISLEEEFQRWRLLCLTLGFVLLLLAPVVSSWVPFYYSSSMAIGICLVIIILLFQGMKLLPTGRKNIFYLSIYGSMLGAGSFLLHHFSMLVNSVLVNFGLNEELQNPVSVFLLVGIVLAGAGLGYWIVRRYVVSEDGSVDVGIAQFVKWAMRIVAFTFIFQSTLDTPLLMALISFCLAVYFFFTHMKSRGSMELLYTGTRSFWPQAHRQINVKHKRAEFFSRSGKMSSRGAVWPSRKGSYTRSESLVQGLRTPATYTKPANQPEYYSTFHNVKNRRTLSKKEWDDFTRESTREAVTELASSPEFTDWIIEHADRIKILPEDSSDETVGSGSDSTDENAAESSSGYGLFNWHRRK